MIDGQGRGADTRRHLRRVCVERERYVESDTALVNRVLGREVGGKQNILVLNDEAHHAYRIRRDEPDDDEDDLLGEEDDADEFYKEATVWIDGLDRIQKLRGINFCVDLSATPYFLGRVGQETNRPFPWVVSDFGLIDAIESGLVKIPQLAVRDTTGAEIPGYFNIWQWILPKLSPPSAAASRTPEARGRAQVGQHADRDARRAVGAVERRHGRRRTKTIRARRSSSSSARTRRSRRSSYEWLAENKAPTGVPPSKIAGLSEYRRRIEHHPRRLEGGGETDTGHARATNPVDALHARHGRQDHLAARSRRASRSIRRASRSWRRSAAGRCTRRGATCAAS